MYCRHLFLLRLRHALMFKASFTPANGLTYSFLELSRREASPSHHRLGTLYHSLMPNTRLTSSWPYPRARTTRRQHGYGNQ
jgi:hypothetical protein